MHCETHYRLFLFPGRNKKIAAIAAPSIPPDAIGDIAALDQRGVGAATARNQPRSVRVSLPDKEDRNCQV
jgi:hypothetical protein